MQKLTPMCGFETRNDDDSNDALSTAILSRVRKIVKFLAIRMNLHTYFVEGNSLIFQNEKMIMSKQQSLFTTCAVCRNHSCIWLRIHLIFKFPGGHFILKCVQL
jgi:hypothetical protein